MSRSKTNSKNSSSRRRRLLKKEGEKPEQPEAEGQPVKSGQMTPEEAKRLLDAQKADEQLLELKPPEKPRDASRPVKDW